MKSDSILRRLRWSMLGFGMAMGVVFPVYSHFFVQWKPGMFPWFALGAIVAGLVVGLANQWMVGAILVSELKKINRLSACLREGDLTGRLGIDSRDQVGEIARSLDQAMDSMGGSIGATRARAMEVVAASRRLHGAHLDWSNTFSQLKSELEGGNQLSRQSLERMGRLRKMAFECDRSFRSMSDRISHQSSVVGELGSASRTQNLSMGSTSKALEGLLADLHSLGEAVGEVVELQSDLQRMGKGTRQISLNAGIEAHRAGQAGRAFSVVADEIRALSQQSDQTLETMNGLLERMRARLLSLEGSTRELGNRLESSSRSAVEVELHSSAVSAELARVSDGFRELAGSLGQVESETRALDDSLGTLEGSFAKVGLEVGSTAEGMTALSEALYSLEDGAEGTLKEFGRFRI